jgi:hypothetical protein
MTAVLLTGGETKHPHKISHITVTEASFIIAKKYKQTPKFPSTDRWINKMW